MALMAVGEDPARARRKMGDGGLDPIGQALRATYDADNHDSLGHDLTGLMLELARVDDQEPAPRAVPMQPPPPPPHSWFRRLFGRARS